MATHLRALILEDSKSDVLLLLRELRRNNYDVQFTNVDNAADMIAALDSAEWDIILSDYSMPTFDAQAALAIINQRQIDIPFIVISGTIGEETAVAAMKAGASDFFTKHNLTRLVPAVERELREVQERQKRKQAETELIKLYNATSFLFKADNLLSLGQQVVQAVVEEFGQVDCGLLLLDKKQQHMIRLARAGQQQVRVDVPLHLNGIGLVPEAVRSGNIVYVSDVTLDSRYASNDARTRSELVVPLRTTKGILGVLDLQSAQVDAFSQQDQRILSAFAERAAAALETIALYEEINRHAAELEQRVIQRTAELSNAKERIEAIFNNSSDAIVLVAGDGTIHQANVAFTTLFGYQMDEVFGEALTLISVDNQLDLLEQALQRITQNGEQERIELVACRKDRTSFNVDVALAPVADYDTTNVICSFRDITEHKQLEENLRQTLEKERELNDLKSHFTSMVSHEFRTPLATIQSSTDLLKRYHDRLSDEKKIELVDKIQKQVKHLTNMMEDILTYSKSQAVGFQFTPTRMDIAAFCRSIVEETQATTSNHFINFTVTRVCGELSMDVKLLRQMITNLLSNAIKYSPQGGEIHFNLDCDDQHAVFTIEDTGIGIPEKDLEHLFEDFHRAENVANISGTGLGLVIVKQAVDVHAGTIRVDSEVGKGTTFTLTFPKPIA